MSHTDDIDIQCAICKRKLKPLRASQRPVIPGQRVVISRSCPTCHLRFPVTVKLLGSKTIEAGPLAGGEVELTSVEFGHGVDPRPEYVYVNEDGSVKWKIGQCSSATEAWETVLEWLDPAADLCYVRRVR